MEKSVRRQIERISRNAKKTKEALVKQIKADKEANGTMRLERNFSKTQLYKLPHLSKGIVEKETEDMMKEGHVFRKNENGIGYCISLDEVLTIYKRRNIPTFRERKEDPIIAAIANLKGGVTKSVSTVSLAHGLRTHPSLICEDLRILVIDLDPQGTATLLLSFEKSVGEVEDTAVQTMLHNLSKKELMEECVIASAVDGVDVLPANIGDAFIASEWEKFCNEDLPNINPYEVLYKTIIEKLKDEYDFIFIDNGPHLDAFLENTLQCVDAMLVPLPPSNVDLHASCNFLERIPLMYDAIKEKGVEARLQTLVGFMTKFDAKDEDDLDARTMAKDMLGGNLLDVNIVDSKAFEVSAETFDSVISVSRKNYDGDKKTLKRIQDNVLSFSRSVFDHLKHLSEDK
ncbi:MAG: ParA family protein [Thalassotalea sp.]|nr:ParA family protein [Thalassotalea sp.]